MVQQTYISLIAVGLLLIVLGIIRLRNVSLQGLIFGLTGAITGLIIGALASLPLAQLPSPFGSVTPILVSLILMTSFIWIVSSHREALLHALPFLGVDPSTIAPITATTGEILVDTSVIIDGRIADIAVAGFVPGRLLVPRFVLAERQNIADS